MSLNNSPLNFNNQTEFVPAKPPEFTNTMTTYERLDAAEKELRSALGSVTGNASATNLRKLLNIIEDVEKVKRAFVVAMIFSSVLLIPLITLLTLGMLILI